MGQLGWGIVISVIAAWLRSEIGVGFEALTAWLLRRSFMQPSKLRIEALRSPTLRFFCAILLPACLLIGCYVFVVTSMTKFCGKLHAFVFIGASIGTIASTMFFGFHIMITTFPVTFAEPATTGQKPL
jgi:hypothetical protein